MMKVPTEKNITYTHIILFYQMNVNNKYAKTILTFFLGLKANIIMWLLLKGVWELDSLNWSKQIYYHILRYYSSHILLNSLYIDGRP